MILNQKKRLRKVNQKKKPHKLRLMMPNHNLNLALLPPLSKPKQMRLKMRKMDSTTNTTYLIDSSSSSVLILKKVNHSTQFFLVTSASLFLFSLVENKNKLFPTFSLKIQR
jgi:hypothetical protein